MLKLRPVPNGDATRNALLTLRHKDHKPFSARNVSILQAWISRSCGETSSLSTLGKDPF